MGDIIKVLFGAMLGFILALVGEPLKTKIQEARKTRRMEKALAQEMVYLAVAISTPLHLQIQGWQERNLRMPVYEYYSEKETELLLHLSHYNQIDSFYEQMKLARNYEGLEKDALFEASAGVSVLEALLARKDLRAAFKKVAEPGKEQLTNAFEMARWRYTFRDDKDFES